MFLELQEDKYLNFDFLINLKLASRAHVVVNKSEYNYVIEAQFINGTHQVIGEYKTLEEGREKLKGFIEQANKARVDVKLTSLIN